MKRFRVADEDLAWSCRPEQFEFDSTATLPSLEGTIGQDRAVTAIDFGLEMKGDGYNVFIIGEPGTGRSSTIKKLLERRSEDEPVPEDWCYVHDFGDGDRPRHFSLQSGIGSQAQQDVEKLVEALAEEIPKVFEGKEFEQQKEAVTNEFQEKNKKLFEELEEMANERGFVLQRTVGGLVLVPMREGEPLSQQDYDSLDKEEQEELDRKGADLQKRLNGVLQRVREHEKEMRRAVEKMERDFLLFSVGHLFDDLEEKYQEHEVILKHLDNCKQDLLNRIEEFRPSQTPQIQLPGIKTQSQEPSFDRYRINLLVDNGEQQGAPVVYEPNPTYFNVFGRIEHVIQMGNAITNFTMIKPGALHRANGGYLVLDCREVLMNLFTYEALKRCLRNREVKIEDMTEQFRLMATVSLKPQPIPLECKIILIGPPLLYYLLFQLDPDFRKYFKVKADFDRQMKNTWDNVQQYALFIATKCEEENLRHFAPSGVARVVEHSVRLVGDKNRLSSRFLDIANLIREASFYAGQQGRDLVSAEHVQLAIEGGIYRSNKIEERIQELIDDGTLLVDVEGEIAGQVNGLAVYQLGDYSFGKPVRLTVRTYIGKGGMINIEREAKLSGPVHDKGVMILAGFFGERYAQDKPLTLAASICFEQSYSGVEGDSASSAELFGLLSALSGLPLRQGIAVTGSVNQHGRVQAIGGVNEKIEGFYAVCKLKGLTGDQGVVIPEANVQNLMLRDEVAEAIREGRFHLWAISHVDEGIELLTGKPAGQRQKDGGWPKGSVNHLVDKRLSEMAEAAKRFGKSKKAEEGAG